MIYLDNAASSWPKPPEVVEAVTRFLLENGSNPGRSGHRLSIEASRMVYEARESICTLVNAPDPLRVVFGHNITDALNLALFGLLSPGDHAVTTSMEHNSVMRPLSALKQRGVDISLVRCSPEGLLDLRELDQAIRPNTRLLIINHGSNVTGTVQPMNEIRAIKEKHNLLLLVDSAQTAGSIPINVQEDGIDLLAFTGHKSLLGITGTGGLVIGDRVDVDEFQPLRYGGTGSRSESDLQPSFLPDKFESGTANAVGLAALNAGVQWILARGVDAIHKRELSLLEKLLEGLRSIPGISIYGDCRMESHAATIGFNLPGILPSDAARVLSDQYDIMCRSGLHCAPQAHRTIGTFPTGCVRFSLGVFNTEDDIERCIEAVRSIKVGQ